MEYYSVIVTAKDGGGESSFCRFKIIIDDINDCSPQFTNIPNSSLLQIDSSKYKKGENVFNIGVTDPGNDSNLFDDLRQMITWL